MDVKKVMQCDVVIVGGGNAGLCSAIEANDRGANVLLLEKAPKIRRGGNSRLTGGVWRVAYENGRRDLGPILNPELLPVPLENIDFEPYPKDAFYATQMRVSQGLADKYWAEVVSNESLATLSWLKKQGLRFNLFPPNSLKRDGRVLVSEGDVVIETTNLGEGLVEALYTTLENRKVPVLYETAAQSLLVDPDGAVCGLIAISNEGLIKIEAKGGVILACGGFEANPEMRRRYLGDGWDLTKVRGTRYNTGDGLFMAMQVGAQPSGHWGGCHASLISEDSPMVEADSVTPIRYQYMYCVLVNINGERFVDEGEDIFSYTYAKMGRQVAAQPGAVAFQIFDAKMLPLYTPMYQTGARSESNSLEGLAEQIGINSENFVKTIKEYNAAKRDEKPFIMGRRDGLRTYDLKPNKTNWAQRIDTPPFRAYAVVRGLTFAFGGLRINEKTQVINTREKPIEGLYAAGEVPWWIVLS